MRFPYKGAGIALFYSNNEGNFILLGQRSDHPFHNRWSVPGGFYEKIKDNSILSNAIREFDEETGVKFSNISTSFVGNWTLKLPFFKWTTFAYLTNEMILDFIPNEFYKLQWVNIKELNKYKLRPFTKKEVSLLYTNRH